MAILTIIRGLQGSGKSTLAKTFGCIHLENDMFKYTDGVYNPKARPGLTKKNIESITKMLLSQNTDVVVSNVFATNKSIDIFRAIAKETGAKFVVKTMRSQYKNVHNVPDFVVKSFQNIWEACPDEEFVN